MANIAKKAWKRVQGEGKGAQKKLTKLGKKVTKPVTKAVRIITRLSDIEKLAKALEQGKKRKK